MNRASTAVLVLSCLVASFALADSRASTLDDQSRRFPNGVNVGDLVWVYFDGGKSNLSSPIDCTIAEVNNGWFRCATNPEPPGVFVAKRELVWYDLSHVAMVKNVVGK